MFSVIFSIRLVKMNSLFIFLLIVIIDFIQPDHLPTCMPRDFHYELTECDATGGRWRVSVPSPGTCTGGAPNAPVRLSGCILTCQPGEYFNMEVLECRSCPPGTYSLGEMIRFDSWETLPDGFSTFVEPFTARSSFSLLERERTMYNCSRSGWQTRGDFLAFYGGPCEASLTYAVRLMKPGILNFTYQYPADDAIFEFQAQNELCRNVASADEYKWPSVTEEGKWETKTIDLPEGLNVLQWKAIGISNRETKPLLIKLIEISGVPPTLVCTPCRNGTYAPNGRSRECQDCPANTYSLKGASLCQACDSKTTYSPPGSKQCLRRPPCTEADYYEIHSVCDLQNVTMVTFHWVEPRICRDDVSDAISLPSGAELRKCPPCNPGMEMDYVSGSCRFCPPGSISDGMRPCKPCPPSTAPNTGLQLLWWSRLPPFMSSRCMKLEGFGCTAAQAWQPAEDHIRTGHGQPLDAYLILSLKIEKGFRGRGTVSFTFELDCQANCQFLFMEGFPRKGISVVRTWSGSSDRQHFTHTVLQNGSCTLSWAFQKQAWDQGPPYNIRTRLLDGDVARIYDINITNTVEGGASVCLSCAKGSDASGCIPCPPGHYTEQSKNETQCQKCPENTFVTDPVAVGKSSCIRCGPGLRSEDGQSCSTDCKPKINGTQYDLRKIGSKYHEVRGSMLFTASGMQYYHIFNISLCNKEQVVCANNISFLTEGEPNVVRALICRTTLIPSQSTSSSGGSNSLSTQSVSLGDHLVGISSSPRLGDITVLEEFLSPGSTDLHIYYSTPTATKSCPQGRTTTVTLRCDPEQPGKGQVNLPVRCPDGTCDGCNFHFLWMSSTVCPICGMQDLKIVKSECLGGEQVIHYLGPKRCIMPEDAPVSKKVPCSTQIPLYLQAVILGSIAVALLLCFLLIYCWKRNKRLEYKYMKLVRHNALPAAKDQHESECETEMAAAESCALHDGEEEEEVSITVPIKGYGLVNKIRSMTTTKSKSGSPFETIQLTEAQS